MKLKINSCLYYSDAVLWDIPMATGFNLSILHTVKWSHDVQSLYPNFWHVGSRHSHFFLPPAGKLFKFMHMFLSCNINSLNPSSFESHTVFSSAILLCKYILILYNFWCHAYQTWPNINLLWQVDWLYYLSFAIVCTGLVIYSTT